MECKNPIDEARRYVANAEETIQKAGYDGNTSKKVCDAGFEFANAIINRCALLYPGSACA